MQENEITHLQAEVWAYSISGKEARYRLKDAEDSAELGAIK